MSFIINTKLEFDAMSYIKDIKQNKCVQDHLHLS